MEITTLPATAKRLARLERPSSEARPVMHFAELVSDRAYVLEKGQIRYQASMAELAANEEVRRAYLSV